MNLKIPRPTLLQICVFTLIIYWGMGFTSYAWAPHIANQPTTINTPNLIFCIAVDLTLGWAITKWICTPGLRFTKDPI